jgi:hypothetical protein
LSINNKNEYIRGAKFGIFGELTKLLAGKYALRLIKSYLNQKTDRTVVVIISRGFLFIR